MRSRSAALLLAVLLGACEAPPATAHAPTAAPARTAAPAAPAPTPAPTAARTLADAVPNGTPAASDAAPTIVSRRFWSTALDREMPYFVYLPPSYGSEPSARYPSLYMLHGMGGSNVEWIGYGLVRTAERMMRSGELPEFVIVLPQGDQSYWMDHAGGGPRWATYAARDVVAAVDAEFRTIGDRRYRAIGGLSMGADGALQIALNHPQVFGAVGAHSPFLRRENEALAFFGRGADYAARDPWSLALARPDVARDLAIWVDVGDTDSRRDITVGFHRALDAAGIPHAWRELIGSHSEEYWGGYSPGYLRFYASTFCGAGEPAADRRLEWRLGSSCPPATRPGR